MIAICRSEICRTNRWHDTLVPKTCSQDVGAHDTRCRECDRKLEDFDRKCGQSRSGYAFILRIKSYLSCLLVI